MSAAGRVWRFGDAVNTDQIIPGRANVTTDPAALARGCFGECRPEFAARVRPGDVIVAGEDFGCGSSREHAVIAIQAAGIRAVVAASFARIFFRNAVNLGLPLLEGTAAAGTLADGALIELDLAAGRLIEPTTGAVLQSRPLSAFAARIARHGGVLDLVRAHGSLRGDCSAACGPLTPATTPQGGPTDDR